MRKIVLSNIEALDPTFQQNSILASGLLGYNWQSFEVNSADECPICHFGIDLSQNSWRNYHDIHSPFIFARIATMVSLLNII